MSRAQSFTEREQDSSEYEQLAAGRVPTWLMHDGKAPVRKRNVRNVMGRRKVQPVTLPKLKCLEGDV